MGPTCPHLAAKGLITFLVLGIFTCNIVVTGNLRGLVDGSLLFIFVFSFLFSFLSLTCAFLVYRMM
jgi:hypothetical protein